MAPKVKEKAKPQSAASTPVAVEDLFTTINRHVQNFQYDKVVKVADQVLAVAPGDEDAIRCKVVALIKADDIDRALSTIQAAQRLPIDFGFHKAYCLYRQNKLLEALETLESQEKNAAVLQLECQILYRLAKMDACIQSYERLQKLKINSLEMKTNFIAALVSAGRASEVQKVMDALKVKSSSGFELAYNTACSLIERERFADAEQQLLVARRIGQEMLVEDDFADDEIENELAPITVQLAHVQQLLGHTQEAHEAYTDIVKRNLSDASSVAVAVNNLIALKGTKDVSDGLRKLDKLKETQGGIQGFQLSRNLDLKLSTRQKEAIYSNRLLLLLLANKLDQAQELVSTLITMFPGSLAPTLLQAAVLIKEKKVQKAEEILLRFAGKYPEHSKPSFLARAQISAAAGHSQIAAESLANIQDIQHMPATVATMVSLRERLGDISSASAVLDAAIQWWKNSMLEDNKLDLIMNEAASFKLKHGHEDEAAKLYEELVRSHGSTEALVGLIITTAATDLQKAEAYEQKLKPLPGLKGTNVDALEKTSGAKPVVAGEHLAKLETPQEVKEKAKSKKKRKRKPRYPKGFDPANPGPPPDPERWLPLRERSSYRPKRKDKRAQIRGSQGAVSRDKHVATSAAIANGGSSSSTANPKSGQSAGSSSKPSSTFERPKAKSKKKSRS